MQDGQPPKTLGESRVRITFNPSMQGYIDQLKQKGAELIDLIDGAAPKTEWDDKTVGEWKRLKDLAMTDIESGTSWAVKASTI